MKNIGKRMETTEASIINKTIQEREERISAIKDTIEKQIQQSNKTLKPITPPTQIIWKSWTLRSILGIIGIDGNPGNIFNKINEKILTKERHAYKGPKLIKHQLDWIRKESFGIT